MRSSLYKGKMTLEKRRLRTCSPLKSTCKEKQLASLVWGISTLTDCTA